MKSIMIILAMFSLFKPEDPSSKIFYKSREKVVRQILKKYDVKISGLGGGMPFGKVRQIIIELRAPDTILANDIDKARIRLLQIAQFALDNFKNDKELESILMDPPFQAKHLRLGLGFNENVRTPEYICYTRFEDDLVGYFIDNDKRGPLFNILTESCEEAFEKAQLVNN